MSKPTVGRMVHFFDPGVVKKIGLTTGYNGRGAGPYAAVVTNDLGSGLELFIFYPGTPGWTAKAVLEKDDEVRKPDEPYWAWPDALAKARAAKAAAAA